jgi:type IV pilus biogenesis protein CpaD/CtpE
MNMRFVKSAAALAASALLLAGCASGGLSGRNAPDEYAVARNAPLVVPPDFALTPPRPGEAAPATDSRAQAIQALFGGPAPRSASENQVLSQAGSANVAVGARSVVGDPKTAVVDKGAVTQTILAVPEGDGQEARTSTPR